MPTTYESLVEEISQIYETALANGDVDWNKRNGRSSSRSVASLVCQNRCGVLPFLVVS